MDEEVTVSKILVGGAASKTEKLEEKEDREEKKRSTVEQQRAL